MRETLLNLEFRSQNLAPPNTLDSIQSQHRDYIKLQKQSISQESLIMSLQAKLDDHKSENEALSKGKDSLEHKLAIMEIEYEELMDTAIEEESRNDNEENGESSAQLRVKPN